jgi:hypothetical protein
MRIIDTGDKNAMTATLDRVVFCQKHLDARIF